MRLFLGSAVCVLLSIGPLHAQDSPSGVTQEQRDSISEERRAKVKTAVAEGQKRQERLDKRNGEVMGRWAYAVCIGCGPAPKGFRLVHTHPLRVLTGVIAADDDAADISRRRRI